MERILGMCKRVNMGLIIAAAILATCAPLVLVGSAFGAEGHGHEAEMQSTEAAAPAEAHESEAKVSCWAFLAAALATGLGSIAAGYAVANVGTAAMGAVAEKPELMGKSLIYVALAEGIAIYGLLISIIVLAKV